MSIARIRHLILATAFATAFLGAPAHAQQFRAYTWGYSNPAVTPNLSQMVWMTQYSSLDIAARQLAALPAGKRIMMMFFYVNDLADNPQDRCQIPIDGGGTILSNQRGPWLDNGITTVRQRVQGFVQGMRARGAKIDGFVFDNETTLHATNFMSVDGAWGLIQGDPRWSSLSTSMGLPYEISSPSIMYWGSPAYYLWIQKMAGRFDTAMNTAVYAPIALYYPAARVITDYESYKMVSPYQTPDITGKDDLYDTSGFGTDDSAEFYGLYLPDRIPATNVGPMPNAGLPWLALRANVHKSRGIYFSNTLRPKDAWIAPYTWDAEWDAPGVAVPLNHTIYWDENVLQLAMNGIDVFLYWNADAWNPLQDPALFNTPADRKRLNDLLSELNARAGGISASNNRTVRLAQPSWSDRVLTSARKVGNQMVWRFSFDAGIASVTVRFTNGTTATIAPEPGRAGAWFTYPASKTIVMDPSGAYPAMVIHEVPTPTP
jgi:hypothetical protein